MDGTTLSTVNQDDQRMIEDLLMKIIHGNSEEIRSSQEKILELEKLPGFALHLLVTYIFF